MNRMTINLKVILQLIGMVVSGIIFIIILTIYHKRDCDPADPSHYVPSDIMAEKQKFIQMDKDLKVVKEQVAWNIAHPTIHPQTPPRKYTYGGWVNLDNTPIQKNKFGMVIKDKPKVATPVVSAVPVSPVQKKTQKMVRYEDWVDEVDELQYSKQPEAPIMKEDN